MYISIDPGRANGVCTYDEKGKITSMQVVPLKELVDYLNKLENIQICICEEYRVYPHKTKAHTYSNLETPRAIGRIESWAHTNKIQLIMQQAACKNMGFKFLGIREPPRSDKLSHAKVAHAHFTYWAIKHGIIKAEDLL